MRRYPLLPILLLAGLCFDASGLAAQQGDECSETSTVGQCFSRAVPELATVASELNKKPTGSDAPGGANPTAIADYLPKLAAALIAPGVTDELAALSFSANLPLNDGVLWNLGTTLQAAVTFHQPEVFSGILDSVAEVRREGVRTRLEDGLTEVSDVQLTLALNLENGRFGRHLRQHSGEISRVLLELSALAASTDADEQVFALHLLAADAPDFILSSRRIDPDCKRSDVGKIPLGCFESAYRRRLQEQVPLAAAEFRANYLRLRQRIESAGLLNLSDLINNQPQLGFTFEARPREVAAGPTTFALRFRGEWSPASLNRARGFCGGQLKAECLAAFLRDGNVGGSLRRGDRFWVTVDVTRQERYRAPFVPDDSATFVLPASWTVDPALGFGFYLTPGDAGAQRSRLDLQVGGSFQQSQGVRTPSRVIASATYSLRMGDNVVGTAGVVWANRPEFLGDDVRRIGARFGVRYKLPGA